MLKGATMAEVAPGLWVGSEEAAQQQALLTGRVKHVLIVASGLKPAFPTAFEYRVHPVLDLDTEDLLSHFDDLAAWVAARQSAGVLIHCVHGVSRSVTVAVACVMKSQQLDASAALARVKAAYSPASPNEGFARQLDIYGQMGARLDRTHRAYKAYLLTRQADLLTSAAPADAPVAALHGDVEGQLGVGMAVYACRACRKRLFLSDAMVAHERGKAQFERKHGPYRAALEDCTSHFVETYTWMGDLSAVEGKLCCPKCSARVGSYNWAGMQCSCGTWVRPAFQIVKSKVDEVGLVAVPAATQKR